MRTVSTSPEIGMSKGQRGNKEAKKPKKAPPPLPAAVPVTAPAPERHKKR